MPVALQHDAGCVRGFQPIGVEVAVSVVKQFTATIKSNSVFTWLMMNASPPFNPGLTERAELPWLVEWFAVPLVVNVNLDSPGIQNAKAGIKISPVTVIQEGDTSLTHRVELTCYDVGNPGTPADFTLTYALYAVFFDT
jgi:hypothetical protein